MLNKYTFFLIFCVSILFSSCNICEIETEGKSRVDTINIQTLKINKYNLVNNIIKFESQIITDTNSRTGYDSLCFLIDFKRTIYSIRKTKEPFLGNNNKCNFGLEDDDELEQITVFANKDYNDYYLQNFNFIKNLNFSTVNQINGSWDTYYNRNIDNSLDSLYLKIQTPPKTAQFYTFKFKFYFRGGKVIEKITKPVYIF